MSLAKQMLTFLTVVEQQSFTRAAEKLFLTPTAVSKQIKLLEDKVGQPLLTRTTRSLKITDMGEQFYTHCLRLKTDLDETRAFINSQDQEPRGTLRILSSLYFANAYLIKYLKEFHRLYPRLELYVDIGDRHPDLYQESFDVMIGFRHLGQMTPQLQQRKLQDARFILCASPAYLKERGIPQVPADLLQHTLLNHPARKPNNLVRFKDGTEIFMPAPELIINSLPVLLQLCCEGLGILMVGEMEALDLIQSGKLAQLFPDNPLEDFLVYAFYLDTPHEQQKISCFLDFYTSRIIKDHD